jgi:hypothetical protein
MKTVTPATLKGGDLFYTSIRRRLKIAPTAMSPMGRSTTGC